MAGGCKRKRRVEHAPAEGSQVLEDVVGDPSAKIGKISPWSSF